jgi:hypothetical protein
MTTTTRKKLSLTGKTTNGLTIYKVENESVKVRAAGGTTDVFQERQDKPVETDRSRAHSRAKRLGVKVHSNVKHGNKGRFKGEAKFNNEDSIAQASGNVVQENINTVEQPVNDYFGNFEQQPQIEANIIDDNFAIQQANTLSVSEQNNFSDSPELGNGIAHKAKSNKKSDHNTVNFVKNEPKERKRGAGFLGRNNRKAKSNRQENQYA